MFIRTLYLDFGRFSSDSLFILCCLREQACMGAARSNCSKVKQRNPLLSSYSELRAMRFGTSSFPKHEVCFVWPLKPEHIRNQQHHVPTTSSNSLDVEPLN